MCMFADRVTEPNEPGEGAKQGGCSITKFQLSSLLTLQLLV